MRMIEVTTQWGYVTYEENELTYRGSTTILPRDKLLDYFAKEDGNGASDIVLGVEHHEVKHGISLSSLRSIARDIVIKDKAMTHYLATQLDKWDKVRWFDFRSVGAQGRVRECKELPSIEARQWLWKNVSWRIWTPPYDSIIYEGRRVNERWTRVRHKQHTDYVLKPKDDKEYGANDTYYVVPPCVVRGYYKIIYPADGVMEK